jgi:hypothetical protein
MTEERCREVVELLCRIGGLPVTPAGGAALSVAGTGGAPDQAARHAALRWAVLQALAAAPVPLTAREVAARVAAARPDLLGPGDPASEVAEILHVEGRGGSVLARPAGNGGALRFWFRRRRRSTGRVRLAANGVPMPPPDPGRPPVRPPGPWVSVGPKQGYIVHNS